MSEQIPVIDLAPLAESGGMKEVAARFLAVYTQYGFGTVINHGIDAALLNRLFEASREFHSLSAARKKQVELNTNHRGYIPINTSTDVNSAFADVKKPNQSESFLVMREDLPDSKPVMNGAYLAGANQWPQLAGFRDVVESAHDQLAELGSALMQVACVAMGVEQSQVMPAFNCPTTWLRLLHYPAQSVRSTDGLYGSAPHTDFGCITILAQDNVAGLQVKSPAGTWIDVLPQPNALVVNVGDMLHRWSNGLLRSTPHRVLNNAALERYSCAFFYDPYVETIVSPLACCISPQRPAAFESIHFGEFLRAELEASYQQHQ